MTDPGRSEAVPGPAGETIDRRYGDIVTLLGGANVIRRAVHSDLDVHEVVAARLSHSALVHLVEQVPGLVRGDIAPALGMSLRTLQRVMASDTGEPLTTEQSGRVWKFAEVLSKAQDVLGSREDAARWLGAPALALDGKRPIDLLATIPGAEVVEDLLTRLEYGVYT